MVVTKGRKQHAWTTSCAFPERTNDTTYTTAGPATLQPQRDAARRKSALPLVAPVAQLAELSVVNREVVGSDPTGSTISRQVNASNFDRLWVVETPLDKRPFQSIRLLGSKCTNLTWWRGPTPSGQSARPLNTRLATGVALSFFLSDGPGCSRSRSPTVQGVVRGQPPPASTMLEGERELAPTAAVCTPAAAQIEARALGNGAPHLLQHWEREHLGHTERV